MAWTMSNPKGPSEGGSGGGRGHSNMEHWGDTAEVKDAAKVKRRQNDRRAVEEDSELDEEPSTPESGSLD